MTSERKWLKYSDGRFSIYFFFFVLLAVFPPVFDWANRIEPRIGIIPFAVFWQQLMVVFMLVGVIVSYFLQSASGELDSQPVD